MMVRLKGKITTINYNRSKKIDKWNENKKKRLTTYKYFLLLMWTGRVKLTMIWKQDLAVTKANTEYNKLKNLKA